MNLSRKSFLSLPALAAALLAVTAFLPGAVQAADDKGATGTWGWTVPGRNGGADRKITAKLKVEGEKLTGKVISPGRDGQTMETDISEGKVKDAEIEFKVVREFNGNKFVSQYKGKVEGDKIKGKMATERNGEKNERDWEAKREEEKK